MRVITESDPIRMRTNVYVEAMPGKWYRGDNEITDVEPQTQPPVYVSLPWPIADLLKVELDGGREPASNRHLNDTIEIRDRLLTLVEQTYLLSHPEVKS